MENKVTVGREAYIQQLTDFVVAEYLRNRNRFEAAWAARDSRPRSLAQEVESMMDRRISVMYRAEHAGIMDRYHAEAALFAKADLADRTEAMLKAEEEIRRNLATDEVTGKLLVATEDAATVMRQVFNDLQTAGNQWKAVLDKYCAPLTRLLALKANMTQRQSMERDRLLDVLVALCHEAATRDTTDEGTIHDEFIRVYQAIAGTGGMFYITEQPVVKPAARATKAGQIPGLPSGQTAVTERRTTN